MPLATRLRILEFLRTHQVATAVELGHALGMTGANIRHHLQVLETNDLIEVIGQRQAGRGRPINVFGLSRRVLGDGLDALSNALCTAWFDGLTPEKLAAAIKSTAAKMAGNKQADPGASQQNRLAEAVSRLNQMHYAARWEAGAGGPRLLLGHCPYSAIIESHPELCRVDKELVDHLTGQLFSQMAKLQVNSRGLPQCIFQSGALD
jgi:predicted ArsR family transcriptional regulator